MTRKSLWFSLLVLPFLIVGLACGGDDDDDAGAGDDAGAPSAVQSDGGGDGGNGGDAGDSNGGGGDEGDSGDDDDSISIEDCSEYATFFAAAAGASGFAGNPAATDLEISAEFFQNLADAAPSEIQADMQLIVDALVDFFEVLEEIGFDPNNPQSFANVSPADLAQLEAAAEALDRPELEQAANNIEAFFEEECS